MTVIHINEKNFKNEALEAKTLVIIDFWAPWCGPCQMMAPVFESLSNKYRGNLKFVKANTDENSELAIRFGIQGIPCLVILDKGKEINRIVGYMPETILKQKIDKIIN
ncbi:MAG: thioredoxin [Nanoarchaeota archaeon]|nr:thioredoxin [Nanoarchaeota archaeon]